MEGYLLYRLYGYLFPRFPFQIVLEIGNKTSSVQISIVFAFARMASPHIHICTLRYKSLIFWSRMATFSAHESAVAVRVLTLMFVRCIRRTIPLMLCRFCYTHDFRRFSFVGTYCSGLLKCVTLRIPYNVSHPPRTYTQCLSSSVDDHCIVFFF